MIQWACSQPRLSGGATSLFLSIIVGSADKKVFLPVRNMTDYNIDIDGRVGKRNFSRSQSDSVHCESALTLKPVRVLSRESALMANRNIE